MRPSHTPLLLVEFLAALISALPSLAHAGAYTSLTVGSGPDDYRSYTVNANAGLFDLPVQLNLSHFRAKSAQADDVTQSVVGLDWTAARLLSVGISHSKISDGTLDVSGNDAMLSFSLNELWKGELRTVIDAGYGKSDYTPAVHPIGVNSQSLIQKRNSVGLRQDLTPSFAVYGSHDRYNYDRNPTAIAIFLILSSRNTSNVAYTLLGFPDKTNSLGITWRPSDSLTLDLSSSKTVTLLEQQLVSKRLSLDYQVNDAVNIATAVTRSSSTALLRASGQTVQAATNDTYLDLTAGWTF
ncbi:MAG: hypothetical protein HZB47_14595 [Nitrosomonadales bacterium]|nr:hypothetical protein [Nitrosomonadales bacterium]